MNGLPPDAQTKALEFVNQTATFTLLATIVLLAWVASGVEFSNQGLRLAAMACLTLSIVYGIATLSIIPLVQEMRRPGQSNFDVEARYFFFGRRAARLKGLMMPQYVLLIAGLILFVAGTRHLQILRRISSSYTSDHGAWLSPELAGTRGLRVGSPQTIYTPSASTHSISSPKA